MSNNYKTRSLKDGPVHEKMQDLIIQSASARPGYQAYPSVYVEPHKRFREDLVVHPKELASINLKSSIGYQARELIFRTIPNAVLIRDCGIVLEADGALVTETIRAEFTRNSTLSKVAELEFTSDGEAILSPKAGLLRSPVLAPVLYANHGGYHVFGHFIFETMASVAALRPLVDAEMLKVMLPRPMVSWPADLLRHMGLPAQSLMQSADKTIAFNRLIVSSSCSSRQTFLPNQSVVDLANDLKRRHGVNSGGKLRLYLLRPANQRASGRQLVNEAELANALTKLGFLAIDPAVLSFRDQIRLFAQAEVIVGLHGSAFANIIFSGPNCTVLDILTTEWAPIGGRWLLNTTNLFGQQYAYILAPSFDAPDQHKARVDIEAVLERVHRLLAEIG